MSTRADSPPSSCTCEVDRLLTRDDEFAIAPARGGGWSAWAEAFTRLLDRLASQAAHCVIVTQDPNQRYVQLIIGHGHAHVEVSSNHYLMGEFRLDEREERLLEAIGFAPPAAVDGEATMPLNWWRNEEHFDAEMVAGLVLTVLTALTGFDPHRPVAVTVFGADRPCAACFWGAA
ncbi:MAG: TY-Chap domain-containing protein [Acidimicrobiia bacterium]